MGNFVDFNELKSRISIEDVVQNLGLVLRREPTSLRGKCPACKIGHDRSLTITPSKNLFWCDACKGDKTLHGTGDQIALVAHIRGIGVREAAEWLGGDVRVPSTVRTVPSTVRKNDANSSPVSGFKQLEYLEADHPATEALGFDFEVAAAAGLGYAPKGILRGMVAVPIVNMALVPPEALMGYIGINEAKLPGQWHFDRKIVPLHPKKSA